MPDIPWLPTRRHLLAGLAVAAFPLGPARGQPDSFRTLRLRTGTAALRGADKPATPVLGFDGAVPGPMPRVKRGEELKVRIANDLAEPATVHWHGVRAPNALAGVPGLTQQPIAPGRTFDVRFTPPDAGTFSYRAFSATQQARGLSGVLIVDETASVEVDRDVALIMQDWRLADDGAPSGGGTPHLTVNGAPTLDVAVKANERLRLRLVNAATRRFVTLRIADHAAFVMAIDGQPAEPFMARDSRVTLGPGNRMDLMIDALQAPGTTSAILIATREGEVPLCRLVYDASGAQRPGTQPEPKPLPANPLPGRIEFRGAQRAEWPLDARANVASGTFGAPLFSVKRGRTVMLALPNRGAQPAAVHIHGHSVRLLDNLDDGWKPFWLDTIAIGPGEIARVAFVADNPGKWLLEGRMIGMSEGDPHAWFEVT
jgi:FtsP/CotA-like multicopper oxidase with cupredoxin domain